MLGSITLVGCGSRTVIRDGEVEQDPIVACELDEQCDQSNLCARQGCVDGTCVVIEEVDCGIARECEAVACNPSSGLCEVSSLTLDIDRDGVPGPIPGTIPGQPGSCGSDCDDTNPRAFPGGVEVCDGADNDCDGVIDNGADYATFSDEEVPSIVRVASDSQNSSGRRGLAYGDGVYVAGYWGNVGINLPYLRGLDETGAEVFPETPLAQINGPSWGATLAWSGATFGATWSDPRIDDNYEIYFSRFDAKGNKLDPDLRVTEADDFSIHPRVIFDQGRFVVVWDDRRDEEALGITRVMGQLIDSAGNAIGDNVELTGDFESAEYPQIAATSAAYGVVYTGLTGTEVTLVFRSFDKEFAALSPPLVLIPQDVRLPRITAAGDLFVVTWDEFGDAPGAAISGVVLNAAGQVLVGPTTITDGATFARTHSTLSLGDRLLLTWTDDLDGNYELYAKVLDLSLTDIEPRRRLTFDEADTIGSEIALGDRGKVGIMFDDWRSGLHNTYFLTIGCDPDGDVSR